MIEIPEANTLAQQASEKLKGKVVNHVFNANSPHKFTFYYGDPLKYSSLLKGKEVEDACACGMFVDICLSDNTKISINDGVTLRFGSQSTAIPEKYQLLITFTDSSFLAFTVAMYGGIAAYANCFDNKYYKKSAASISPLSKEFSQAYFEKLIAAETKNISLKALLATEQRIPGVGNGVLQDILFNAQLNPKRKIQSLTTSDKERLFKSLKETLKSMTDKGGRDTETDLFGCKGGYKTLLSKNTYKHPCPKCDNAIVKESYMGGTVYYCPSCQPL